MADTLPPPPLPGMLWGKPRRHFVPHSLQCGCGHRDPSLGDGGVDIGGGGRGTC